MKAQVVGISERRSGTAKASGKAYDGTTIHCILSRSKDVVAGQAVKEIYINHTAITVPHINIGDIIDIEYDDKGYIENIEVVKPAAPKPAAAPPVKPQ